MPKKKTLSELTPTQIEKGDLNPDFLSKLKFYYSQATHNAAIAVHDFLNSPEFDKADFEQRKVVIDGIATDTIGYYLKDAPFHTIHVGSEGAKEIQHTGKAAPSLIGKHGLEKHPEMWLVSDPVEGTTAAGNKKPGALSILAVTPHHGILETTQRNSHYLNKLVAPSEAKGIMSLKQDHAENLYNLSRRFNIPYEKIVQVMMTPTPRRHINQKYFDAAKKAGVKTLLIDAGDLVPSIKALGPNRSDEVYIFVGRGGREEGIITAAFAKTMGGFMEAIEYNEDPEIFNSNPLLELDDLVPADIKTIFASGSFITDDPWFDQKGVRKNENGIYTVTTMTATYKGLVFTDQTSPFEKI